MFNYVNGDIWKGQVNQVGASVGLLRLCIEREESTPVSALAEFLGMNNEWIAWLYSASNKIRTDSPEQDTCINRTDFASLSAI